MENRRSLTAHLKGRKTLLSHNRWERKCQNPHICEKVLRDFYLKVERQKSKSEVLADFHKESRQEVFRIARPYKLQKPRVSPGLRQRPISEVDEEAEKGGDSSQSCHVKTALCWYQLPGEPSCSIMGKIRFSVP